MPRSARCSTRSKCRDDARAVPPVATVAVSLAVIAPLAVVWRPAGLVLVLIDLCWIGALVADAVGVAGTGGPAANELIGVTRVAPVALSVGRPAVVDYEWTNTGARRVTVLAREQLPDPLGRPAGVDRRIELRPQERRREHLTITPVARGRAEGGSLALRVLGRLGLVVAAGIAQSAVGRHGVPESAGCRTQGAASCRAPP